MLKFDTAGSVTRVITWASLCFCVGAFGFQSAHVESQSERRISVSGDKLSVSLSFFIQAKILRRYYTPSNNPILRPSARGCDTVESEQTPSSSVVVEFPDWWIFICNSAQTHPGQPHFFIDKSPCV